MTGFLRKKNNKQLPVVKPVPSAPIPLVAAVPQPPPPQPPPQTPLYSRFATKTSNNVPPRIVSSPMVLSGKKEQRRTTAADASKKRTTQNQAPNKALPQVVQLPPLTPPAPIINKPLPPPSPDPSGSPPTQSFMLAVKHIRSPPSAFQKQPQQPQGRPTDDAGDNRPPSAQSFYSVQTSHTDQSLVPNPASRPATANSNNNSLTSPPKRNLPLSNGPQTLPPLVNRKMHEQNHSPAAFGRQNLHSTAQTQNPHLFQSSSAANQDLHPTNVTTLNGSMIGASSTPMGIQPTTTQGTPQSDRLEVDLPPEFALFHEFSQFTLEDRNSVHSHRIPSTINPKERVPASNVPPSSMYSADSQSIAPRSSALSPAHSRENLPLQRPQFETQPPLPPLPPPSQSGMGVTSSHVIGNGLLPSSVKDFYPPRVSPNPNLQSSLYHNPNPNNPSENQPQMLNQRHPLPPLPNQDFSTNFSVRSENRTRASSYQDLQQPTSGSSRKSIYSHAPTVPMKGKPRIFAALAVQEDELNRETASGHVQPNVKKLLSQSIQQPLPQHQPSAPELNVHMNGIDQTFSNSLLPPRPSVPSTPKVSTHIPEQQLPTTPPSHNVSTRSSRPKPDEHPPSQPIPKTPSRSRKLSKPRTPDGGSLHHLNGSNVTLLSTPDSYHRGTNGNVRTFTKSRPTTPVAPAHKPLFTSPKPDGASLEPAIQLGKDTISKAGIPLDDDPFARVEGVTLLKPSNSLKENDGDNDSANGGSNGKQKHRNKQSSKCPSISSQTDVVDGSPEEERKSVVESESASAVVQLPPTPISPEEHRKTRKKQPVDDSQAEPTLPPLVDDEDAVTIATAEDEEEVEEEEEPEPEPIPFYPMAEFLSDPQILSSLLTFLSFYDWCLLSSLSKEIRMLLVSTPELRETVLERFLKTVGYSRWTWEDPDPLSLSLQDLNDYMRGVSTPTHEYARVAAMHVHSLTLHPNHRDPMLPETIQILTASTRAYTRVILRLRAQAEKEAILAQQSRGLLTAMKLPNFNYPSSTRGTHSRVSSRAPSPTASSYSLSHNGHNNVPTTAMQPHNSSQTSLTFRSPLFRLRRAPLLRVFVPSPEGDWLSDKSVLACESECKRAGVSHLMRLGDVVWDVAVGDEGNVGRLVWDGSYLIDLDYTYTSIGDLPKYMPTLAFPPSYFHRVIRTGPVINNPIVHIDISPWGEEIAMNLQLLQDRVRTETPQGTYHNVVRWVHRSSFMVRPRRYSHQVGKAQFQAARIPIPETDLYVDPGWYGTIVVETESTNEALADLKERCGPGAFPARSRWIHHHPQINQIQIENQKVFRILREKSRPGEIWIKAVGIKERLL